jgi:hypothetical protein
MSGLQVVIQLIEVNTLLTTIRLIQSASFDFTAR